MAGWRRSLCAFQCLGLTDLALELVGGICLLLGLFVPIFGFLFICDMTAAMIFRSNQLGWNARYDLRDMVASAWEGWQARRPVAAG